MAVNAVSNYQSLIATLGALSLDADQAVAGSQTAGLASTLGQGGGASQSEGGQGGAATISQTANLLSTLSKLETKDPQHFAELSRQVSQELADAAAGTADPVQHFTLKALSAQFSNAAASGSLTGLTGGKRAYGARVRGYGVGQGSLVSSLLTGGQSGDTLDTVNSILSGRLGKSRT